MASHRLALIGGGLALAGALSAVGLVAAQPAPVPPAEEAPPVDVPTPAPLAIPAIPPEDLAPAPRPTAVVAAKPTAAPARRARYDVAVIRAIDKVTAESIRFEARVGQPVRFKGLIFTVKACERSAPDEAFDDSIAYLTVESQPRPAPGKPLLAPRQVYRGWMYASSPGVHPLEHPVYDAWLMLCRAATPAPGRVTPPAAPAAKAAPPPPPAPAATPTPPVAPVTPPAVVRPPVRSTPPAAATPVAPPPAPDPIDEPPPAEDPIG
ncbi:DUF2155 domain-containing protein [Phenylobacterium immobile]|uniref:DUF2155 domain-containing protein n=1 Tax=Phenylobacterium immobile TaxID=21 RepID=UPI001FE152BE|nr:DUF2155 domain-containing protein [Phenylobacterium immobile]